MNYLKIGNSFKKSADLAPLNFNKILIKLMIKTYHLHYPFRGVLGHMGFRRKSKLWIG